MRVPRKIPGKADDVQQLMLPARTDNALEIQANL
jgi:hypothetical protein